MLDVNVVPFEACPELVVAQAESVGRMTLMEAVMLQRVLNHRFFEPINFRF